MSTMSISIRTIDRTFLGATTPGQSGPRRDGSKGVFCIHQRSRITDCLVSYPGQWSWEYYPSAEMQSVYSLAPKYWVRFR